MRHRQVILSTVAAAVLATMTPSFAAPKPLCNLIVDNQKNDGYAVTGGAVLRSPAMDIHSGDIATGKRTVVAVMRLQRADTNNDPVAALGLTWNLLFKARGTKYQFQRVRNPGLPESFSYNGPGVGPNSVKESVVNGEIVVRFTVDRGAIPELKKPKTVFDTLAMTGTVFTSNGDSAGGQKDYPDRAPSCLRPA